MSQLLKQLFLLTIPVEMEFCFDYINLSRRFLTIHFWASNCLFDLVCIYLSCLCSLKHCTVIYLISVVSIEIPYYMNRYLRCDIHESDIRAVTLSLRRGFPIPITNDIGTVSPIWFCYLTTEKKKSMYWSVLSYIRYLNCKLYHKWNILIRKQWKR